MPNPMPAERPEPTQEIREAHKYSSSHREQLNNSSLCGCFYCCRVFHPSKIKEWCDGGQTAICPFCMIDSIIAGASGFPITPEFMERMRNCWFWHPTKATKKTKM